MRFNIALKKDLLISKILQFPNLPTSDFQPLPLAHKLLRTRLLYLINVITILDSILLKLYYAMSIVLFKVESNIFII